MSLLGWLEGVIMGDEERLGHHGSRVVQETIMIEEIGPRLAEYYRMHDAAIRLNRALIKYIKENAKEMGQAIDALKAAVADENSALDETAAMESSAFDELISDIAALPSAADVQAAADAVVANTKRLRDASTAFSQSLRDVIPTAVTPPPGPTDQERYQTYLSTTTDVPPLDFDTWLAANPA